MSPLASSNMFLLEKITKSFGEYLVINNLSLQFEDNRYCIFGPNGSGKSTLLMLMSGIEDLTSGSIKFNEKPVNLIDVKYHLGVSSDKIFLPDFLSSQQLLEFHCTQHNCSFPTSLIQSFNFKQQLTTKVSQLSLGNLKKISLLLALAHQPMCLILDEPTTGLDQDSKVWLLDYLNEYDGLLIVASHEESFINNKLYQQIDLLKLNNKFICKNS